MLIAVRGPWSAADPDLDWPAAPKRSQVRREGGTTVTDDSD
jgi:hypothetical protein